MDALDRKIIDVLSADARYSHAKIAVMLGREESEISARIEELERTGVIVKYTAVINPEKTGEDFVDALIEVKVTPQKSRGFDAIAEQIYRFEEVKSLYLMSGAYDLAVLVEGKTLRSVADFVSERLAALDTVISTATHFILKKYKTEGVTLEGGEDTHRLAVQP